MCTINGSIAVHVFKMPHLVLFVTLQNTLQHCELL